MKILVYTPDEQWNELTLNSSGIEWKRCENKNEFTAQDDIDAYFDLSEEPSVDGYGEFGKPVFINAVSSTLKELNAAENITRINGWKGFIKRSSWEISGKMNDENVAVLKALGKNAAWVPDEPGFIAARIIAMIINEAYFAKGENVSTEKEIDIAMKLGTNYPYGPFEWAGIIGIKNIFRLLAILHRTDERYRPSQLLEAEAMKAS